MIFKSYFYYFEIGSTVNHAAFYSYIDEVGYMSDLSVSDSWMLVLQSCLITKGLRYARAWTQDLPYHRKTFYQLNYMPSEKFILQYFYFLFLTYSNSAIDTCNCHLYISFSVFFISFMCYFLTIKHNYLRLWYCK